MPPPIRTISILIAGLFLTMVFAATACEAVHGLSHHPREQNRSQTDPLHTVLCNWACHTGKLFSAGLASSTWWHSLLQSLGDILFLYALLGSFTSLSIKPARAPPHPIVTFSS